MRPMASFWILASLLAGVADAAGAADERFDRRLDRAREVYERLLDGRDFHLPDALEDDAECIAIIPGVIKGAIGWGGRHGRGVISCRHGGGWSPPVFIKLSGGSVGFQIGGQSTDFVLFFMTERSIDSLLRSKFILGGDVSISAGPLGRTAEGATDARLTAEIIAYARSRGLFAGASLEGARLAEDQKAIREYYGRRLWPEDILRNRDVPEMSAAARRLLRSLP